MQLIGMLDSPYVRRVAVSLQFLGLPFEHRSLSVFRTFEQFQELNPVVKAPSLICEDGTVLMDSTLILEYAESIAAPTKSLMPQSVLTTGPISLPDRCSGKGPSPSESLSRRSAMDMARR